MSLKFDLFYVRADFIKENFRMMIAFLGASMNSWA